MKKFLLYIAVSVLCTTGLQAQDLTGKWQGTLRAGTTNLRYVFDIYKGDNGGWSAKFYSIDQPGAGINVTSVTRQGPNVKIVIGLLSATFQGKLSADGNSISGNWTQGPSPIPFDVVRTTPETAWEIPAAPPAPKLMPPDADPSFEVATIKPNPSGGSSMQQFTIRNRDFTVRNGSLMDLIASAYSVQAKQIVNGPDWMNTDRYDISGIVDQEGVPSDKQFRSMIQKLLADRFRLTFHRDHREMAAFVLTADKSAARLPPTQLTGPLPGLGYHTAPGGMMLSVRNGTISDFAVFLQAFVLDRPVVDQTHIDGKFDFDVTFTPDESMFNGRPPHAADDTADPAPDLFVAMQQQIGIKLTAEKTEVPVIAIDHVERPTPN